MVSSTSFPFLLLPNDLYDAVHDELLLVDDPLVPQGLSRSGVSQRRSSASVLHLSIFIVRQLDAITGELSSTSQGVFQLTITNYETP
jgi:hypothetical protein